MQGRTSILHTAPWVDGKTWDAQLLDLSSSRSDLQWRSWKALVADRGIDLSIIYSARSGSGKSHWIKEQMRLAEAADKNTRTGSITLHEGTTIHSLVKDLVSCFPPGVKKQVVHFSFVCMPERHQSGSARWLADVNHFFFSILELGCAHDPSSPLSFRLGEGEWKIFVELPSEEGSSAVEWLWRHIPVLAICGTVREPPMDFTIDEEARRVCTYLRAYDNGTINRKLNSSKQIVFVLDISGSMESIVGGEKSALTVAVENSIAIFDSHIQPGDVSTLQELCLPSQRV